MRAALLKAGTVVTVAVMPDDFAVQSWDGLTVVPSETAGIGDTWDGTKFTRPAPVAPPSLATDLAALSAPAGGLVVDTEARAALAALKAALLKDAASS